MNYWILSTWKSLRPTSMLNKYLWRKWITWSACGNHVPGMYSWTPKLESQCIWHLRTQISALLLHDLSSNTLSPLLILQCSEKPFQNPISAQTKSDLFIMLSHRILFSVKLTVTLNLHICVRLFNEVLSLLPVCLQSCRFLFNIISLLPHLSRTHCGPSINRSEWIHTCNMDWKWKM